MVALAARGTEHGRWVIAIARLCTGGGRWSSLLLSWVSNKQKEKTSKLPTLRGILLMKSRAVARGLLHGWWEAKSRVQHTCKSKLNMIQIRESRKKAKRETKIVNFEKLRFWRELRKNGGGREQPRKRPD
jgi:hypothetical protein